MKAGNTQVFRACAVVCHCEYIRPRSASFCTAQQGQGHSLQEIVGHPVWQVGTVGRGWGQAGGQAAQLLETLQDFGGQGLFSGQLLEQRRQGGPAVGQHLAQQQVDGLNLVGAFIDHGHARVAHDLFDPPFAHIPMTAEDLQAGAGTLEALVRPGGFEHGGDQAAPALCGFAPRQIGMVFEHVKFDGGAVGQQAATIDPGALGGQDALDGRVVLDEAGLRGTRCTHLAPLLGVGMGLLPGGFEQGDALQAYVQAGRVHHDEHGAQAAVRFADQPARGVFEAHHAGRAAMQAHLLLDALAEHAVGVAVGQDLGREKERQAFGAGRRIGQARQHQVHDVVGQVVLATGDEDFAAADAVAAVGLGLGLGAHQA